MVTNSGHNLFVVLAASLVLAACSTVKSVPEGEYRLTANVVNIDGDDSEPALNPSEVSNYIRQKPNSYFIKGKKGGWNPFLYVYNWDNGKNRGWDRFVHKIGHAPVILDENLVDKSETNVLTHLRYLGYYNSQITDTIVRTGDRKAYVEYDIRPGKRYPISSINYEFQDSELGQVYLADSASILLRKGEILSEKLLETESSRAADYLKNHGYWEFSKNFFFFEADTMAVEDSAALTVFIRNYTRHEKQKDARPHCKFYFSDVKIVPISDEIKYMASLNLDIPLQYDTVSVDGIDILYSGKRTTRPSVIYDMNRIRPGDMYSDDVVNNTYNRFTNMRSFNTVSMQLGKSDSNRVACSIILLPARTNGYRLNLEASVNSTGLFGIAPAVSYFNRNIFHGGEWLQVTAKGNFQFSFKDPVSAVEFGASTGLSFPTFVLLPDRIFKIVPRTDVSINYNYQRRPDYTRNRFGADFGYSWNTEDEKWSFKLHPVQANVIKMGDTLNMRISDDRLLWEQFKSHFELGAGFSFSYMSVPSLNPAVSNFKATFSMDMAGNLLSAFNGYMPVDTTGAHTIFGTPYSQFVRTEASATYTWKFGKDNRQAFAIRGIGGIGIAYGNSEAVPYERQFWVGGANSMRGWNARDLGPGGYSPNPEPSIPSQTGDIRLEANAEYRFPLVWKLNGAAFFDCGNVWYMKTDEKEAPLSGLAMDNFLKTIALNTGFGLRADLSIVVIRLDLGIKLYDPQKYIYKDAASAPVQTGGWRPINTWFASDGFAVHFGIGYPF